VIGIASTKLVVIYLIYVSFNCSARAFFLVRAVIAAPHRERFDRWYATDHLPWAMKAFQCKKAWRF
jgi:hypothetical protein